MVFGIKDISTLDDVLESSWRLVHEGVRNFKSPFHHPALTTIDDNRPQARIVILRGFSEKDRTLIYHCDVRSPKQRKQSRSSGPGNLMLPIRMS